MTPSNPGQDVSFSAQLLHADGSCPASELCMECGKREVCGEGPCYTLPRSALNKV